MPVLAFRLATPSLLVDLRRLPGLGNIAVGDDGFVREPHPAHTGVTENQHGRVVHRGTKGSNPLSSTGESANPRSPGCLHPSRKVNKDMLI
jgi:hypothetical protein